MIRPTRPTKIAALALGWFTALMLIPHAASAKPKVALTAIDGDASGDVHDAVAEALEGKDVSLISPSTVNRAVDKLGDPSEFTDKELKKLETQLEADAIVLGTLERSGGSKSLKFRIFVHKKMAKGFTVNFKDPKSKKFHKLLHDKIVEKISAASGDDAGGGGDDEPVATKSKKASDDDAPADDDTSSKKAKKAKKGKKPAADDDAPADEPVATKADKKAKKGKKPAADVDAGDEENPVASKKKTDDEPPAGDDDRPAKADKGDKSDKADKRDRDGETGDDEPRPKKKVASSEDGGDDAEGVSAHGSTDGPAMHSAATPGVRVDLGVSVLKHSYTFNKSAADVGPKDTSLSPVPGVRLDGEVYPFNLSGNSSGALAGLGLGFDYDRTISLSLNTAANGMSYSTSVKQQNYSFGLRYRLAFGKPESPMVLTFGLGYGKRLFSPDKSKIMDDTAKTVISRDTPTTEYTLLDPGAAFRLPVARTVAIGLGLRGLIITNGGPIQSNTSYGQAKAYGVEAQAGVDIQVTQRIVIGLSANFDQIGLSFQGKGALSLDADQKQIVGGLADRGIGGAATVGLIY